MSRRIRTELAALRAGLGYLTAYEIVGIVLLFVHLALMAVAVATRVDGWRVAGALVLPVAIVTFWAATIDARNAERREHAAAEQRAYLQGVYDERMGWTR